MRNHIDPLVDQTQVSHQSLHHTGLLEDGISVGSLGRVGTEEVMRNDKVTTWTETFKMFNVFYSQAFHWSQNQGSRAQQPGGSAEQEAPISEGEKREQKLELLLSITLCFLNWFLNGRLLKKKKGRYRYASKYQYQCIYSCSLSECLANLGLCLLSVCSGHLVPVIAGCGESVEQNDDIRGSQSTVRIWFESKEECAKLNHL